MQGHFLLCGFGQIGHRVLNYLKALGYPITVIDNNSSENDPLLKDVTLIRGDFRQQEILQQANIQNAIGVFILTGDDLVNLSTGLAIYRLNPQVPLVIRMFNQGLIPKLSDNRANVTSLSTSALAAPMFSLIAQMGDVLGGITLPNGKHMQVTEIPIRAHSPYNNKKLADVLLENNILLVAHQPKGEPFRFVDNFHLESKLTSGDRIVVCGERKQVKAIRESGQDDEPGLHWANFFLRHWRILRRTVSQIDLPVKFCFSLLVIVVIISTLIFHFDMERDTIPDAFYRTVSIMATMADMRMEGLDPQGWQKVFVGLLRLTGAALIAAFTAILTNYLVRANLGSALEIRRIPEKGHIVVCGLGNVGYRVVEDLLQANEKVVVIESSSDNRFVSATRRKGVAVMIGDGTVRELLEEAHVGQAKAVVAATAHDLSNLQIALLVSEINPDQRIVLRLTDTDLARTLKETTQIRYPLSIPDIAAPAFIASLFGDRVHSVFFLQDHIMPIIDMKIGDEDTILIDRRVRAVIADYNEQPL